MALPYGKTHTVWHNQGDIVKVRIGQTTEECEFLRWESGKRIAVVRRPSGEEHRYAIPTNAVGRGN